MEYICSLRVNGFVFFKIWVIFIFLIIFKISFNNLLLLLVLSKVLIVWLVSGFNWRIMELRDIFKMFICLCEMVFFRILVLEEFICWYKLCFICILIGLFIFICIVIVLFGILFRNILFKIIIKVKVN